MLKTINIFLMLIIVTLTSGCATIVRGTKQEVSINTQPTGAHVQSSNGQSCTTPCTISAERNKTLQVTITKEGYHTHTTSLMPTLAGGGVLLGGLIDYGTGAVYDLQPNPYTASLIPCNAK